MNTSHLAGDAAAVVRSRTLAAVLDAAERALSRCGAVLSFVRPDPERQFAAYSEPGAWPDLAFEALAGLQPGAIQQAQISSMAIFPLHEGAAPAFALALLGRQELTARHRADLGHFAALAAAALANAHALERSAQLARADLADRALVEETKQALQFSLDSGQIGDWDLDLVNDTSRRSLRHDQCFGYDEAIPEAQWGAARFLQHVHPADRAGVEAGMREAVASRKDWAVEFRVVWNDGSLHWLVARGRVYRIEGDRPTRMLGIVTDVTERRRNEELLRETQASLEFALDAARVGDWDLDLVRDTSRRSLRHDQCFGYAEAIPEGRWGIAEFIRHVLPAERARVEAALRAAATGPSDFDAEFPIAWPDGSVHWLVARGKAYRAADGSASRMLGVVMDISDRKQAEAALGASRQLAMGQVNALARTLDALAAEPSPERLAEHVLRTMTTQLGAQSCSVWRREDDSGLYAYECSLEDDRIVLSGDPLLAGVQQRVSMHEFWPDADTMVSAEPSIMADIHADLNDHVAWRKRLLALGVVTVLMLPMMIGGRLYGTVSIRFARRREFQAAEIELAKALANQTMLALRLNQLTVQARAAAVIEERNRMARDIHDTLAQGFTGVIIQLEAASDAAGRGLAGEAQAHVDRAKNLARESLTEARRSVLALRPPSLADKGLGEALEALLAKMTAGTGMAADFALRGSPRALPAGWDENLLRIVQEAATNALRHAGASRFEVQLMFDAHLFTLRIADNGCGFDRTLRHEGFGLRGIGERIEAMGGSLNLLSRPGEGVALSIALPLPTERP